MTDKGRSRLLAGVTTLLFGVAAGCQVPPGPDLIRGNPNASTCPNGNALANFKTDAGVSAAFSNNGTVTTYLFASLTNENPADGVPGLIKYCVYPTPEAEPTAITVQATGANGAPWTSSAGSDAFAFARPNGNPSNIPLDGTNLNGTSTVMGTATWAQVPTGQAILLHINDPAVCAGLYGDDPGTCFVLPGQALACVLDHGETNVAYNAIPFGAEDCPGHSWGFEATATREFGDEVELETGTGRDLTSVSLKVLFSSYACQTGHWNTGDCLTTPTPPQTFTHPITANIYAVSDCAGTPCVGTLLATATQDFDILYRPSADNTQCTGSDAGKWFNTVAGICKNSISMLLTFTNFVIQPNVSTTLPERVIWTVAYNTTHYGAAPIGELAACFGASGGCPYDSFNVGVETFTGAPYAGTDVDENAAFLNSSAASQYCDNGAGGVGLLRLDGGATTCWSPYKPLGEIITR